MVQIGDFNFGRKQDAIPRRGNPLLLAWPLNNYWDTNFAASQPGLIHLRYQFATHGAFDPAWALKHGHGVARGVLAHPLMQCAAAESGSLVEVGGGAVHLLHLKPAEDGRGVIVRLVNVGAQAASAAITFPGRQVRQACLTTPMEVDIEADIEGDQQALRVDGARVDLALPSMKIASLRVVFE
jgi:hypothetical protein